MTVDRFVISLEAGLARRVRQAAGRQALSTWLADAADRKLRAEGLLGVISDWEVEHGELTVVDAASAPAKAKRRQRRRR